MAKDSQLKSDLALAKMEIKTLKAQVREFKKTVSELEFKLKNQKIENYRLNIKAKRAKEANEKLRTEKRAPLIELRHEVRDVKEDYNRIYGILSKIVEEGCYE